jgi:hypothetical protein
MRADGDGFAGGVADEVDLRQARQHGSPPRNSNLVMTPLPTTRSGGTP